MIPNQPAAAVEMAERLDAVGALADRSTWSSEAFFAALYHDELIAVFEFVYGLVGEQPLAEDLTHDAFLDAYERFHQLRDRKLSRAWLFAIARNVVRQHWRRKRILRWVGWEDSYGIHDARLGDERDEIVALLAELSAEDREIVLLKGLLGFSAREIGVILGIRDAAAQKRWERARRRLRRLLEAEDGVEQ